MSSVIWFALGSSLLALIYGGIAAVALLKKNSGNDRMKEIAAAIALGAKAYLNRQYKTIGIIAFILAVVLYFAFNATTAIGFLVGAILSGAAGYIGMNVSVRANSRVAQAAVSGLKGALAIAFQSGAITGLLVVGLALLGVAGFFAATGDVKALIGLSFGASLISVFSRLRWALLSQNPRGGG